MSRIPHRWTTFSLAAALLVAASAFAQDREQGTKSSRGPDRKASPSPARNRERASGVIIKSEPIRKGARSRSDGDEGKKGQAATHRLTINTAAVWRDWVRDQAGQDVNASPREQARRGADSVATKGEPKTEDTEVVVDIGPTTNVETRFRASTDETSTGAKSPEEARDASEDPAEGKGKGKGDSTTREKSRSKRSRGTQFQAEDLKAGLFVEVDFRHRGARNVATTVTVIRPLGGPDAPPAEPASDEGKGAGKAKGKSKTKGKR